MKASRYRYPDESATFYQTIFLVALVILLTSSATFFGSAIFVGLVLLIAYSANRSHHDDLINQGMLVTSKTLPELNKLVESCAARLNIRDYQVYVIRSHQRNAYTFGIHNPKVIVLYSSLLEIMDRD
ncbi:MAG: M48 family metalloprotease, partial [Anaerolineales bacterium]